MASVALLLLLASAAVVADHGLLDLSHCGLTTIDVVNVSVDATSLTVNLSHNVISSWGDRPFLDLRNVTFLDLSHNRLRSIDAAALADVPDVRELNLSDNALVNLGGRPFRALLNVVRLDLSKNNLEALNGSFLGDLLKLQSLNLRQNKLVALEDADLRGLAKLQWLDVSDNKISSTAAGALRGLNGLDELVADYNTNLGSLVIVGRRLQKVSLRRSGLTAVPASLTRSVRSLVLRENRLKGVRCGDLDSYPLLRELDLSQNDIETIEDDALGRLEQLVVLRLSFNPKLRIVPPGLPAGLTSLELVGNHIESLSTSDFQGLRHLRELNLSGNPLKEMSAGAFRPLEALETLDLSASALEALHADVLEGLSRLQVLRLTWLRQLVRPASWLPFPVAPERLTVLDLSNSPVLAAQLLADTAALTAMRQLAELRVESDGLATLRPDLPSLVGRLRRIHLRDNPLNCSESALSWFSAWTATLDINDARCATPESLRGQALSSLRKNSSKIALKDPTESNSTTTSSSSIQPSPLVINAQSTMTSPPASTPHLGRSKEQVLHHTTVVAKNLSILTLVSSMTTHNTPPPTQFPAPSNSSLTTAQAVIDPTHSKYEKSKHSAAGNKPINTEAPSQSSTNLLTSTPLPNKQKHPEVSQQETVKTSLRTTSVTPSTTVQRPMTSRPSTAVPTPATVSTTVRPSSEVPLSTTVSPSTTVWPSTTVQPSTAVPLSTAVTPSTTVRSSTTELPSTLSPSSPNGVRTEAVTSTTQDTMTPQPTSGSYISETTHVRIPPPSREGLRAERPASNTSSLLAMFGVGAVGSALVLVVLAAAQAGPRPRLVISSFNNSRNETIEEYDDTRADLW